MESNIPCTKRLQIVDAINVLLQVFSTLQGLFRRLDFFCSKSDMSSAAFLVSACSLLYQEDHIVPSHFTLNLKCVLQLIPDANCEVQVEDFVGGN